MKNKIKFIIILLVSIPCFVSAKNFNDTRNVVNSYMENRFESDYSKYIINDSSLYGLNSSYNVFDSSSDGFKTGGLLNSVEFLMSKRESNNESSWLYELNGYWTMTKNGNNRNIINSKGISSLSESSDSNVRVTEYVRNGTRITGKGTYTNPWVISKNNLVKIVVSKHKDYDDLNNEIEIEPITTTSKNPQAVEFSKNAIFNLNIKSGYVINQKETIETCGCKIVDDVLTFENVTTDITCRILYNLKNIKLTFDANGGEEVSETYDLKYLDNYPVLPTTSRTGYIFEGWYTSKTEGIKIESNEVVLATADLVLYARWKPIEYTIKFDANGGSGNAVSDMTVKYDEEVKLNKNKYGKPGFLFNNWNTKSDNTGKSYINEQTIKNLSTSDGSVITLYAQYRSTVIDYDTISNSFMCANISRGNEPYIFTYTGDCEVLDNGYKNWKVRYLTSGDLTFNADVNTDLFVVGGGGYNGGGGGYASTFKNIKMEAGVKKHIQIGAAGTSANHGGKSYYQNESVYYADGGTNGNGGTGSNNGGYKGSTTCSKGDPNQEWNDNWCVGGWVTTHGGNGNSYGVNQYSQSGKPWSGQSTCEFDNGTISGCYDGNSAAYAPGGGGCDANYLGMAYAGPGTNGTGLLGNNSGAGGNCYQNGYTGVVVMRSKIPRDIVVDGKVIATYTGNFDVSGDSSNWKITFKTDGDLKFIDTAKTDVFVVGGGGGNGGAGGYATTYSRQNFPKGVTYSIKIGRGGSIGSGGEQSYVKSNSVTYYANGGSAGHRGTGGSGGGYNYNNWECTVRWDQAGCVDWGYVNYNGGGAAYGNNGNGTGQYYSNNGPWSGQTTCEFNEGSIFGCYSGDGYAYSGGGSGNGAGTAGGGGALNVAGTNGRGGGGGVNAPGGTGTVIIRKMKVNEIKVGNKVLGDYSGKFIVEGDQNNWKVKFTTSGILYLYDNTYTDIFVVGGGGGNAGGGGYTNTYRAQTLVKDAAYTIRIGLGGANGSGEQTYMNGNNQNFAANGGAGGYAGSGGSGGGLTGREWVCTERWDQAGCVAWGWSYYYYPGAAYGASANGAGQGRTTCEFGEGTTSYCYNGAAYAYSGGGSGTGAASAGGGGASGQAGTDNRGGGGGVNARGGSGILIIRNKR